MYKLQDRALKTDINNNNRTMKRFRGGEGLENQLPPQNQQMMPQENPQMMPQEMPQENQQMMPQENQQLMPQEMPPQENQQLMPQENQQLMPQEMPPQEKPPQENQQLMSPQENQQLMSPQENQQLMSPQENQQLMSPQENQQLMPPQENQQLMPPQENQQLMPPQNQEMSQEMPQEISQEMPQENQQQEISHIEPTGEGESTEIEAFRNIMGSSPEAQQVYLYINTNISTEENRDKSYKREGVLHFTDSVSVGADQKTIMSLGSVIGSRGIETTTYDKLRNVALQKVGILIGENRRCYNTKFDFERNGETILVHIYGTVYVKKENAPIV